MSCWAVALEGHQFDVEDARVLFGDQREGIQIASINISPDRRPTVLMADDLDDLNEPAQVLDAAQRIVDHLNGILFIMDSKRQPLSAGAAYRRMPDGNWDRGTTVLGAALFENRSRVHFAAVALSSDGTPIPSPPMPQVTWLREAGLDDVVGDVLTYLRGTPDWFDLYKAFERMRDDINRRLGGQHRTHEIGWPDFDDFTEAANVHRHSPAKWGRYDPSNAPMSLNEARGFVQKLVQTWLDWRYL